MIKLTSVSQWYGQVIGLNDVTCEIGPGLTALLGINGAGKSTLMKLVTGQLKPTTGSILVHGEEPFANTNVFKQIGYCPEIDSFYERWSGRKFVNYLAQLGGMESGPARQRTEEVLRKVDMFDRADKKIAGYSKGMRQRIKLAQALVHDPSIILLDEPLNGLDPLGRRQFINLLGELAEEGKCVMVSSHILYEVEQMTRSLLLLHRGRLLATGDLKVIRSLIDKYPHKIRITCKDTRKLSAMLVALPNVLSCQIDDAKREVEVEVMDPNSFYQNLENISLEYSGIEGFSSPDNNLESVFHYLVNA